MVLSASVIAGMFIFTYVPQLAIFVFINGPLAVFTTVVLVLSESSTIINTIARTWLLQDALLDTFDGTLVARNATAIVSEGREIKPGSDPMQKLGKILKSPFGRFSPKALIRYLIYLPLNFIPVIGTGIFILLRARTRGTGVHGRVSPQNIAAPANLTFRLVLPTEEVVGCPEIRLAEQAQRVLHRVRRHLDSRTTRSNERPGRFGLVATVLEMIPFASMIFSFTNTGKFFVALEQTARLSK